LPPSRLPRSARNSSNPISSEGDHFASKTAMFLRHVPDERGIGAHL
jgi:hypothetical protein